MRKFLIVASLVGLVLGMTGTAIADFEGPTGSDFDGTNVECGHHEHNFLHEPIAAYNNGRGLEVCADGGLGDIQFRAFLDSNETPPIYLPDRIHADVDDDMPLFEGGQHILDIDFPF
ncbi:MAG: hypothetical protein WD646_07975 [Actinomycetota bacterium]